VTDTKSKPRPEPFTPLAETRPKRRGSQLLMLGASLVIVAGAGFAMGGNSIGLVLLGVGFAALLVLMVWAVRNWDWER